MIQSLKNKQYNLEPYKTSEDNNYLENNQNGHVLNRF